MDVNFSYKFIVKYSCSLKCIANIYLTIVMLAVLKYLKFKFSDDKWIASVLNPHLRRRYTKSKKCLVIGIVDSHGLAWAKWTTTNVICHKKGQSLSAFLFYFIMCEDLHEYTFIEIAFGWGPGHIWLHMTLEGRDHTTIWFWRCLGIALHTHFLLGSHNFKVMALGSCVKWP